MMVKTFRPFKIGELETLCHAFGHTNNGMVSHIDERHCDQDTLVYPIILVYRQYIKRCRNMSLAMQGKYSSMITRFHRLLD